ncbi:MAG: ribonuclease P protein component [Opitutae bacterium]|nr:ribonuclease P protein component [Opitutae bacterium]MCD8299525.1 ribonuclease P protein component [Opitutae bacterium]
MRFPASHRIRRQADFSRLRAEGSRYNCGSFVLNAAPPAQAEGESAARSFVRFGVIASKKMVGNLAVDRNRAKRIFRQIFRENPEAFPPGWDVIVVARRNFSAQTAKQLTASYLEGARRIIAKVSLARGNKSLPECVDEK